MREIEKMEIFYKCKAAGDLWLLCSSSQIPMIVCHLDAPCVNASPIQSKTKQNKIKLR